MATIPYTKDVVTNQQFPAGVHVIKWVLPSAGDDGAPYYAPQYSGKAVQMTAGGVATVDIQGTLVPEGTTAVWGIVHRADGGATALTAYTTANGLCQILEDCYGVRPNAASAALTVYLFVTTVARR